MKKILVLLLISFASFAQIPKRTISFGSRVFNYSENIKSRSLSLSPSFGIFIAKNTEFGVSLNFYSYRSRDDYSLNETNATLSNYLIYYFGKKKTQPYVFGQIYWGDVSLKIGGGVQYLINPNVGAFAGVSLGGNNNTLLNVSGGFSIYIPRKNK